MTSQGIVRETQATSEDIGQSLQESDYQNSRSWRHHLDSFVALAIFLTIGGLLIVTEAEESWHSYAANHETWELDELPSLFAAACLALLWLFLRRGGERTVANERLKQAYARQQDAMESERRRNMEARVIGELNEWIQTCKSLNELFEIIEGYFTKLLPLCKGSIYVYSNSRDVLDGVCSWNGAPLSATIAPDECWALRRGRTYVRGENAINFTCPHVRSEDTVPHCCIPIVAHGETVGLISLQFGDDAAHSGAAGHATMEREIRMAVLCAEHISLGIANVRLRDQLRDQSIRDALTGLYNRRYMLETLRREVSRAHRNGRAISLLSLDIDHFKRFNDNHGHDAGDMVLRCVGEQLTAECRGEDVVCRMGGEEFVVILPETGLDGARMKADHLLKSFESLAVRYGDETLPRITVSIGIATYPGNGSYPQELLKAADHCLYRAKANGRNRVEFAPPANSGGGQAAPGGPVPDDGAVADAGTAVFPRAVAGGG